MNAPNLITLKCENCGAELNFDETEPIIKCKYCEFEVLNTSPAADEIIRIRRFKRELREKLDSAIKSKDYVAQARYYKLLADKTGDVHAMHMTQVWRVLLGRETLNMSLLKDLTKEELSEVTTMERDLRKSGTLNKRPLAVLCLTKYLNSENLDDYSQEVNNGSDSLSTLDSFRQTKGGKKLYLWVFGIVAILAFVVCFLMKLDIAATIAVAAVLGIIALILCMALCHGHSDASLLQMECALLSGVSSRVSLYQDGLIVEYFGDINKYDAILFDQLARINLDSDTRMTLVMRNAPAPLVLTFERSCYNTARSLMNYCTARITG